MGSTTQRKTCWSLQRFFCSCAWHYFRASARMRAPEECSSKPRLILVFLSPASSGGCCRTNSLKRSVCHIVFISVHFVFALSFIAVQHLSVVCVLYRHVCTVYPLYGRPEGLLLAQFLVEPGCRRALPLKFSRTLV